MPLLAVSLGYFMVILDATAVNLALPALRHDLGGGITGLQWVVDGYTLAFAALLLSAGVAGDRFGPRRVFLAGLALFTAASAGCALAPAIGVLVLIRLIQGAAAALLVPTSLALLQASYPDRARRARAVGLWGGIGGLAAGVRGEHPGRAARLVAHPPHGRGQSPARRGTGPARRPGRPAHRH
ncbi:MAG: major facilitator superfamily transporter multidrug efflux transporter, partial [Actinomycetia bacterium]|nr:major facilitator superfamily transporter multidrug efflux transporter [Actinomycetes bacterium]